jgi:hypothetical protein
VVVHLLLESLIKNIAPPNALANSINKPIQETGQGKMKMKKHEEH